MREALITKNKLGFIDGSVVKPAVTAPEFQVWLQCNTFVKTWMLNSMMPNIAQSVMYKETARDVWLDLKKRFSRLDVFRLGDMIDQVHGLKQGDLDVTTYYTKLKTLWDEIDIMRPDPVCTCNPRSHCNALDTFKGYAETEKVVKFLKGLNGDFSQVLTQAQLMMPVPSLDTVFAMALKLEDQRESDFSKDLTAAAFYNKAYQPSSRNMTSQNYQQYYQPSNTRQEQGQSSVQMDAKRNSSGGQNHKKLQCTFCHYTGHTADKCYH